MKDLNLTIIQPTDASELKVTLPTDMTGKEILENLISEDFIPDTGKGYEAYELNVKGGSIINGTDTLGDVGAASGDTLTVSPLSEAG